MNEEIKLEIRKLELKASEIELQLSENKIVFAKEVAVALKTSLSIIVCVSVVLIILNIFEALS